MNSILKTTLIWLVLIGIIVTTYMLVPGEGYDKALYTFMWLSGIVALGLVWFGIYMVVDR